MMRAETAEVGKANPDAEGYIDSIKDNSRSPQDGGLPEM